MSSKNIEELQAEIDQLTSEQNELWEVLKNGMAKYEPWGQPVNHPQAKLIIKELFIDKEDLYQETIDLSNELLKTSELLKIEYKLRMETVEAWKRDTLKISKEDDELLNMLDHDSPIAEAAREWVACPGPTEEAKLKYLVNKEKNGAD